MNIIKLPDSLGSRCSCSQHGFPPRRRTFTDADADFVKMFLKKDFENKMIRLLGHSMRILFSITTGLFAALYMTACVYHGSSKRYSEDEILRQKLLGEWAGSATVSSNEVISFKTMIGPDGSFSAQDDIYVDGHFVRVMRWGGTYVVTNRAVVCTITHSTEKNMSLPRKVQPEPIIHLDDHECVIINENGMRVVSRRVSK